MIKSIAVFFVLAGICSLDPFFPLPAPTNDGPRRIEVVARRVAFAPASINLKKGVPVMLLLKSVEVPHGIRLRELNVEVKAPKGESGAVQFTPEKAGEFAGHCSVFRGAGHRSMTLTLHVIG